MPLTPEDLAWVRSEIGPATPPTDDDLDDSYDLLGSREAVVLGVLKGRLAVLLGQPTKLSLDGHLTVDNSKTIDALRSRIGELDGLVSVSSSVPVAWAGGLTYAERENPPADFVPPYFRERDLIDLDPRSGY